MAPRGNADIDRLGFTKWPPFVTFWPSKTANETRFGAVEAFHKFHNEGRVGHDQHLPYWNEECVQCNKCFPKQHWTYWNKDWWNPKSCENFDWSLTMLICLGIGPFSRSWQCPGQLTGICPLHRDKNFCISFILHGVVHDQACWSWWKKKPQINSCQENVISVAIPNIKGDSYNPYKPRCVIL